MKQRIFSQIQKTNGAPQPNERNGAGEETKDFAPSAEEVARKAYFTYVNQGSPEGCAVQHWLEAEADLIAERALTRMHGFHSDAKNNSHGTK
jgi:Protein of unknown function (DUF2934)